VLLQFMREEKSEVRDAIARSGQLDEATEKSLRAALDEFAKHWADSYAQQS
jgi:F0F1-type ATP synthase alpha subunit